MPSGIAMGIGGLIGGIAGGAGKETKTVMNLAGGSAFQDRLGGTGAYLGSPGQLEQGFTNWQNLLNIGPGASDVASGLQSQKDLAALLATLQASGGTPEAQDYNNARQAFAPQQEQLRQQFEQNRQAYAQQAAIQGRNPLDPVFANQQYTEQANLQSMLNAQQGAYAMQQPLQRLGFAQQRSGILSGLATQAMQNRQALMSAGSDLLSRERSYQLGASGSTQTSGGGLGGVIGGALAGIGAGAQIASGFGKSNLGAQSSNVNFGSPYENYWGTSLQSAPGSSPYESFWNNRR